MEFFRQKERIQVIKYIYLFKKKKIKTEMETEAGAHLAKRCDTLSNDQLENCKRQLSLSPELFWYLHNYQKRC